MKTQIAHTTIASGDSQSGLISFIGTDIVGILVSIPTSCSAYIRGSFNTTSATFSRIAKLDGSGDFTWAVGSGSKAISLKDIVDPFPYLKLESSVAMTAVGSITVITKF